MAATESTRAVFVNTVSRWRWSHRGWGTGHAIIGGQLTRSPWKVSSLLLDCVRKAMGTHRMGFAHAVRWYPCVRHAGAGSPTPGRRSIGATEPVPSIDMTATEGLVDRAQDLRPSALALRCAAMQEPVQDPRKRFRLLERVGAAHFSPSGRCSRCLARRARGGVETLTPGTETLLRNAAAPPIHHTGKRTALGPRGRGAGGSGSGTCGRRGRSGRGRVSARRTGTRSCGCEPRRSRRGALSMRVAEVGVLPRSRQVLWHVCVWDCLGSWCTHRWPGCCPTILCHDRHGGPSHQRAMVSWCTRPFVP
jgi:hypothetical protein